MSWPHRNSKDSRAASDQDVKVGLLGLARTTLAKASRGWRFALATSTPKDVLSAIPLTSQHQLSKVQSLETQTL